MLGQDAIEPMGAGPLGERLASRGPRIVVVTLGALGSFACTAGAHEYHPAFAVETADATGCGDAFIAGLLVKLVNGDLALELADARQLRLALRFANAAGAITAQRVGVIPALPTAADVAAFLAER